MLRSADTQSFPWDFFSGEVPACPENVNLLGVGYVVVDEYPLACIFLHSPGKKKTNNKNPNKQTNKKPVNIYLVAPTKLKRN